MSATLDLASGDAALSLAPAVGGAIAGFSFAGHDVLRPSPAAALAAGDVRALSSYPLVPYSNRIANATLAFDGVRHRLAHNFGDHPHAIHGVGWQRPWRVVEHDGAHATLELVHAVDDDAARLAWPWPFVARQSFALSSATPHQAVLVARLSLRNAGGAPFPFGLGWHPYFPRDAATRLAFHAGSVWLNDATQLPRERVAIPPAWRFDEPRPVDAILDQVFNGWSGSATLQQPGALTVTVEADAACGHLVVYAPAGRDYLAVEPVTHETDAFNRAAAGAGDTGTRVLPPGAAFSCTMRVFVTTPP